MKIEKTSDAQLGRSFEFSLPKEWSRQEQIDYTTEYIQKTFVDKGMFADWSIHNKGDGNPHVHLLVTMRSFNPDHSWGNKEVKDWDFVRDENGNIVVDESHSEWWQDKKNPDRHGIRIPVLDENGNQKVGARNRKQWKRVLTDATGWNNPKNCELWRSEWANVCNAHLKVENHIDHRSYARQGKFEIPTIHEGADARKIDEKFQNGQTSSASWKVEENQIIKNAIPINLMVFLLLSHVNLYWNPMLCERLAGRTGIFLKSNLFICVIYIYFHANIYYHISMKRESI